MRAGAEGCEYAFHAAAALGEWGKREDFVRVMEGRVRLSIPRDAREVGARQLVGMESGPTGQQLVQGFPVLPVVVGQRVLFPIQLNARTDLAISSREIIGVVEDFPAGRIGIDDPGDTRATLYEPIAPGEEQGVTVFARMRVPLADFAQGLEKLESRKVFGKVVVTF